MVVGEQLWVLEAVIQILRQVAEVGMLRLDQGNKQPSGQAGQEAKSSSSRKRTEIKVAAQLRGILLKPSAPALPENILCS